MLEHFPSEQDPGTTKEKKIKLKPQIHEVLLPGFLWPIVNTIPLGLELFVSFKPRSPTFHK